MSLKNKAMLRGNGVSEITFIDLFAGMGGFHLAMHAAGARCVFASEWDAFARKTYLANFKDISPDLFDENFAGDITKVNPQNIPRFDILCAGFPCQPFSLAGLKKGFDDTRGNLFFTIADILKKKSPKAFFLENVKHLRHHDGGNTLSVMQNVLEDLGYSFFHKTIRASDFGLPQHRARLFMVGFRDVNDFDFPEPVALKITMSDILGGRCEKRIGHTLRVGGMYSRIDDKRNWATYRVDDEVVRLTSVHGLKMQGFPRDFKLPVSETQAMKQLGNSVAVPVVRAVGDAIVKRLRRHYCYGFRS